MIGPKKYDREWTNALDGQHFYGVDDNDGTTTWYDDKGNLDYKTLIIGGNNNAISKLSRMW